MSGKKAGVKTEQNWKVVDIVTTVGKSLGYMWVLSRWSMLGFLS